MAQLYVQTAFLGDLFLAIPALKTLRRKNPESEIHLVCREGLGRLFEKLKLVDEAYEVKKGQSSSYRQLKKKLKKNQYEKIFCPHESFRSALLVKGLNSKHKVGFDRWWNAFAFNIRRQRPMELPEALRQIYLLGFHSREELAPYRSPIHKEAIDFRHQAPVTEEFSMQVSEQLEDYDSHGQILIAPGSVWNTKKWTAEGFVEAATYFSDKNEKVSFIGSPDEASLCAKLCEHVPGATNLAGRLGLYELLCLMKSSKLLIGNDSGAMHMAAAAGLPSLNIFGPTTLNLGYRPWQSHAQVLQVDLDCRPCGTHGGKTCPIGTHQCMKDVSALQVIEAAKKFL